MSKTLVIVESPTKAKTISKFLGSSYIVESSFGHLRDLPKSKMGIDIEGGTFEPTYDIPKDKAKHVKKLKAAAKKCDTIFFATDEDREGEAISWHLTHILGIDPDKAKRMVFHEITKHAIEEALANPRPLDQKLVDAQQTRRILDRLVGYELSPFLWKKVARGLSAGRVQSVAVRIIVDREKEIKAFNPEEYWSLEGLFSEDKKTKTVVIEKKEEEESGEKKTKKEEEDAAKHAGLIAAKLHSVDGKKLQKLSLGEKKDMDGILKDLEGAAYTIDSITQKETKRTPPPPFRTSTLQQTANSKYGYSSRQTMVLAQQLYEGIEIEGDEHVGLITYMRTDSNNLSKKFLDETAQFVASEYGDTYTIEKPRVYGKKAKGAQEAHEAIRPTDPTRTPKSIKKYLDAKQYKLYKLIWSRAVATQMADAKLNKATLDIVADKYMFRASGQSMIFNGWLKLYPDAVKEEMLPELTEKESLYCATLKPEQHFTKPPARYSDATLVKVLEEYGIGRPSTYAPTIGTIEARNYVERDDNKRLKPTDVAFVVNDLLEKHFTTIVDYQFTAQMEDNLDAIAEGKEDWQPIISTFYRPFHENLERKEEELSKEDTVGMRELGKHPEDGKPVYARVGRYGPFVQWGSKDDDEKPKFAKLKKDQSTQTIELEEALVLLQLPKVVGQDEDGHDIKIAIGRFGPYVQVEKTYYSIKEKEDDPYKVDLKRALEIIKAGKEKKAKQQLKIFEGSEIKVLDGRYGPYITDGNKNAKIPKDREPTSLTLKECEKLIEEAPEKKKRGGWKRKKKEDE